MSQTQRVLLFAAVALTTVVLVVSVRGCGYGEVSQEAYQYSKALYAACNRRDEQRLQTVIDQIDKASDESTLSSSEHLIGIAETANGGDWESAMKECRRLMDDQINRRQPVN